jgi:hypothetical protein
LAALHLYFQAKAMLLQAAMLGITLAANCGPPPLTSNRPTTSGEHLTFDIKALGVTEKGGLSLTVGTAIGSTAIDLSGTARFSGPFVRVRGSARSWISTETLLPTRYHDEADDGTFRSTDSQFDRPGPAVRVNWLNGARRGMNAFLRGPAVLDLLSALFYLRSAQLAAGTTFCFDVVGGRTYWRVTGRVLPGTERLRTPAGNIDAVRLDGSAVRSDDLSRSHRLQLWLSADTRRLPLSMMIEAPLGGIRATLASNLMR